MKKNRVLSIRFPEEDIEASKEIAAMKRMHLQEWLRIAIHEAIAIEKKKIKDGERDMAAAITTPRMSFGQAVLEAAYLKKWDVFNIPFQPSDLGMDATKWGSFSDQCVNGTTASSRYSRSQYLLPVEFDAAQRPRKYLLVKNHIRIFRIQESELGIEYSELYRLPQKTGYSFEIIGVQGNVDLSLVCCHNFETHGEAKSIAEDFLKYKFEKFPEGGVGSIFLEDITVRTRVNIEKNGAIYSIYWGRRPLYIITDTNQSLRSEIGEIDSNFSDALLTAKEKLGHMVVWKLYNVTKKGKGSQAPGDPFSFDYEIRSRGEGRERAFDLYRRSDKQAWQHLDTFYHVPKAQNYVDLDIGYKVPDYRWEEL